MIPGINGIFPGSAEGGGGTIDFDGALLTRSNTAAPSGPWDWPTEVYDRGGLHSSGADTKLIVPKAGLWRFASSIYDTNNGTYQFILNGAAFDGGSIFCSNYGTGDDGANGHTAILSLSANDYIEISGSGLTPAASTPHWFGAEYLAPSTKYAFARRATSNQSMSSGSTVNLIHNSEITDTYGVYDSTTGVITIPSGWDRVRVTCGFNSASAANGASVAITDTNGSFGDEPTLYGFGASSEGNYTFNKRMCISTAVLEVSGGETFLLQGIAGAASSMLNDPSNWVCIEQVPNYTRALVYRTTTLGLTSNTTTQVAMDAAVYGGSLLSSGGILVPASVQEARVSFGFNNENSHASLAWTALNSSGSARVAGFPWDRCEGFYNTCSGLGMWSPVTPGDRIDLYAYSSGASTTLPVSKWTWLCAEFR